MFATAVVITTALVVVAASLLTARVQGHVGFLYDTLTLDAWLGILKHLREGALILIP